MSNPYDPKRPDNYSEPVDDLMITDDAEGADANSTPGFELLRVGSDGRQ